MTKKEIAGVTVDLDDEGYMTHHAQWTREVAAALQTHYYQPRKKGLS